MKGRLLLLDYYTVLSYIRGVNSIWKNSVGDSRHQAPSINFRLLNSRKSIDDTQYVRQSYCVWNIR
jgi:hypothetical protein